MGHSHAEIICSFQSFDYILAVYCSNFWSYHVCEVFDHLNSIRIRRNYYKKQKNHQNSSKIGVRKKNKGVISLN
jgi:hypothetical protein